MLAEPQVLVAILFRRSSQKRSIIRRMTETATLRGAGRPRGVAVSVTRRMMDNRPLDRCLFCDAVPWGCAGKPSGPRL